jgi:hypothetical protein
VKNGECLRAALGRGPGNENSLSGIYGLKPMRAQRISISAWRDLREQLRSDRP